MWNTMAVLYSVLLYTGHMVTAAEMKTLDPLATEGRTGEFSPID